MYPGQQYRAQNPPPPPPPQGYQQQPQHYYISQPNSQYQYVPPPPVGPSAPPQGPPPQNNRYEYQYEHPYRQQYQHPPPPNAYDRQQYAPPPPPGPPPAYLAPSPSNVILPAVGHMPSQWQPPPGTIENYQLSNLQGKKKALLIGINYFGQRSPLSGCINDVKNMRQFLTMNYGFNPENIICLTDDQNNPSFIPTRVNITNAMRWLVGGAQPGDSLFFHFSGHGGQVADVDGDESDGKDETIYPVDHQQAGQILDDEMNALMVKHLPPGVRLTAVFDSCHSGSALDLPFTYLPNGTLKKHNPAGKLGQAALQGAMGWATGNIGGMMTAASAVVSSLGSLGQDPNKRLAQQQASRGTYADVVMFSGCKDRQTSADTSVSGVGATGAMSYALIRALNTDLNQSYAMLLGTAQQRHTMSFWHNVTSLAKETSKLGDLVNSTLAQVETRIDKVLDIHGNTHPQRNDTSSSSTSRPSAEPDVFPSLLGFPSLSSSTTPKKVQAASALVDVFGTDFLPALAPVVINKHESRKNVDAGSEVEVDLKGLKLLNDQVVAAENGDVKGLPSMDQNVRDDTSRPTTPPYPVSTSTVSTTGPEYSALPAQSDVEETQDNPVVTTLEVPKQLESQSQSVDSTKTVDIVTAESQGWDVGIESVLESMEDRTEGRRGDITDQDSKSPVELLPLMDDSAAEVKGDVKFATPNAWLCQREVNDKKEEPDDQSETQLQRQSDKQSPETHKSVDNVPSGDDFNHHNTLQLAVASDLDIIDKSSRETPPVLIRSSSPPSSPTERSMSPGSPKLNASSPKLNSASIPSSATSANKETRYMNDVITQRERQLLQAMQDHAVLIETNNHLRMQVEELIEWKRAHEAELEGEREDSGIRISQLERVLDEITRERDSLRQSSLQSTLDQTSRRLHAKEEEIKGLLLEGERLSKTELKYSNIIKQQKSKITDMEKIQTELTRKLEASAVEVADLRERVIRLIESEKTLNESLRAANEVNEQQAQGLVKLEGELAIAKDAHSTLQSALDRAWLELAETRRLQAEQNLNVQSAAIEKELKQNEELHRQLDLLRAEYDRADAAYKKEIFEARAALSGVEDEAGWREDNLRKEVALLQARLQFSEARHEDLMDTADDSTRPLLRQIEALQTQHQASLRSWEALEKNLILRLHEAEYERQLAAESERSSSGRLMELKSRTAVLEIQTVQERTENSRLRVELETERSRGDANERKLMDVMANLDAIKASHSRELEHIKDSFKQTLAHEIQEHQTIWEEKVKAAEKTRSIKEAERQRLRYNSDRNATPTVNSCHNPPDFISTTITATTSTTSPLAPIGRVTSTSSIGPNADQNLWTVVAPPAAIIDRWHMTIRQYEGQVAALQNQLNMAEKLRDDLAEEMVKLTNQNEELNLRLSQLVTIENERHEITNKYNEALDLLGEQTERIEELQQDIKEMKEVFHAQLNALMIANEGLRQHQSA
ncbi:hypothetical protein SeLEV6574_g00511 [Synchytrium endobioticum]|uniref:Uncharacterized protein n=1 Tax=Synchytrium endobioticum TaxID=286115 RepID=A0A507DI45_9FUNG|nr:hypothetical protein SeLEV6574_g00511 [Synchytrium endobioticum]